MLLMMLGGIPFLGGAGPGFNKVGRKRLWRWGSQARIGGPIGKQALGKGENKISIAGAMLATAAPGFDIVAALSSLADSQEPQMLVNGRGMVIGMFVIVGIDDDNTMFIDNGQPMKIDFTIELEAFGGGQGAGGALGEFLGGLF